MPDASEYAWQGRVIKLTRKDYDQWKAAFSHIDLDAALLTRDIQLAEEGNGAERKRWFVTTATWLHAWHENQKRMSDDNAKRDRKRSDPNRDNPFASQFAKELEEFDRHKWEKS